MSDHILQMQSITKTFPGVKALQDVNLSVRRGEIHAICGENGAGKSTLMKVLSGVYPHGTYDGEILFDGEKVEFGSINDSEDKGIVIIHQELALVPYLSVAENIFLATSASPAGSSTGTRPTPRPPSCSPGSAWTRTPPPQSASSASASSSWWRSPRHCPRRSSC